MIIYLLESHYTLHGAKLCNDIHSFLSGFEGNIFNFLNADDADCKLAACKIAAQPDA